MGQSGQTCISNINIAVYLERQSKDKHYNIIQDTVLSSISAGVLFSLAVGLATVIDAHAALFQKAYSSSYYDYDYDSQYPSIVPGNAAAVSAVDYHRMMNVVCMLTIQFPLNCRPLDSSLHLLSQVSLFSYGSNFVLRKGKVLLDVTQLRHHYILTVMDTQL